MRKSVADRIAEILKISEMVGPGLVEIFVLHDDTCAKLTSNGVSDCSCEPDIEIKDHRTKGGVS